MKRATSCSFWSREEIENENLLAGSELVYLRDPFDAYLLQVQGSGKVRLPDGTIRAIRFGGHNGHGYKSIGKLLVDEGKMTLEEASVPAIRSYLAANPDEIERILHYNPRYIFFKWGDDASPQGSTHVSLTPGRSIAIDRAVLPAPVIAYLVTEKPRIDIDGTLLDWEPLRRFVLPQDSGAAIKGPGRADLFLGSGRFAELNAGQMKQPGKLYFLIARKPVQ